jgi:hypothetical protein
LITSYVGQRALFRLPAAPSATIDPRHLQEPAFVAESQSPTLNTSTNNLTSTYTSTIASYITRAVEIAKARGLTAEINTPYLKLRRRGSLAALLFHPGHIVLEVLEVEPCKRHQHHGSEMLDDVITIGDALRLRIDLIAESATQRDQRGLVQSTLESWYRRHHFVGADDVLMRRGPRGRSAR